MATPQERVRVGLDSVHSITELLQRVRAAHPTKGLYEASELQWWWTVRRPTDSLGQLFWFDEDDCPLAAVIVTDFGDGTSLLYDAPTIVVSVMPDATPDWVAHVIGRGLSYLAEQGMDAVELEVDQADDVQRDVLFGHGFTVKEDGLVECWLAADARPEISSLHDGYRLVSRADIPDRPHHMSGPRRPDFEERLGQISLYRPELDLVVLDHRDEPAAHALFWYDPTSATGSVEPVRTYDDHQQRGLSRHLLTSGLERVARAGAERIAIGYEPDNPASGPLYRSLGFEPHRRTDLLAGPTTRPDRPPS